MEYIRPTQTVMRRSVLKLCAMAIVPGLTAIPVRAQKAAAKPLDVPFAATPQRVAEKMLEMAKVNQNDLLYDLGSGDGRLVITAARKYDARGIGIDLDPERVRQARANAKKAGVQDKVEFRVGDIFTADFSDATVVTLYLLNSVNRELRPRLWQQLKPGTRVVSHAFGMGPEWPPEKSEVVGDSTIYYWTITDAQKRAASK